MEKEKVHNFGGRFLYFCVKVEKSSEFRFLIYDFFLISDFRIMISDFREC